MEASALFTIATELQALGKDTDALRCFLAMRLARAKLHLKATETAFVDLCIAELYLQLALTHADDHSLHMSAIKCAQDLPHAVPAFVSDILPVDALEWGPRRLRCKWMLLTLQKASHNERVAILCEGANTCDGQPELDAWHAWFVATLQDQLDDVHAAVLDRSIAASTFGDVAAAAYRLAAHTADATFKLWLLETLCHSFLAADTLVVESATKMFDFCSQFARQVQDASLSYYFHLVRLLLYLRQGSIIEAKGFLDTIPKAPTGTNPFWALYAAFMAFRLQCYYDPNQGLALAAKQMARWPPYLASPNSVAYLRYSALALFETYEVACVILDSQGRFGELADLATRLVDLCATYRHIVVATPLVVARVHIVLARYAHSLNAMDAAVTHINSAFSLLLTETPAWPQQSDASLLVLMDILDVATTIAIDPLPALDPAGTIVVDVLSDDTPSDIGGFYPTENLLEFAAGILRDAELRKLIYDGPSKEVRAKYDLYLGKWLWASHALGMTGSYPELDGLRSFGLSILQDCLTLASSAINCSNTTAAIMVLFGPKLATSGKVDEGERTLTDALKIAIHTKNVRLQLQILVEVHASCARKYEAKPQSVIADKYKKKLASYARKVLRAQYGSEAYRRLLKWTLPKEPAKSDA